MEKIDLRDYQILTHGGTNPEKEIRELQKKHPEQVIKAVLREHANGGYFIEYWSRLKRPSYRVALEPQEIETMFKRVITEMA